MIKTISILGILLVGTISASSHDIYTGLRQKDSNISCCDDSDCRPVKYKFVKGTLFMLVESEWVEIPREKIQYLSIPHDKSEDKAHFCGIKQRDEGHSYWTIFCAIIAPGGV